MTPTTVRWYPLSHEDYRALPGKAVYSRDGEEIGSVNLVRRPDLRFPSSCGRHYLLLNCRSLGDCSDGPDQVYLPETTIERVATDRIVVSLTKSELREAHWGNAPDGWEGLRGY